MGTRRTIDAVTVNGEWTWPSNQQKQTEQTNRRSRQKQFLRRNVVRARGAAAFDSSALFCAVLLAVTVTATDQVGAAIGSWFYDQRSVTCFRRFQTPLLPANLQ